MTGYLSFQGRITPLEWGKSVYTILPLPSEIAETLIKQGAKRVEGEINDHPVNLALTKAPVMDGVFLWAGKTMLSEIGIAPGDEIEVRLRKADPDIVETPHDIAIALRRADKSASWQALTPGKQRSHLHSISTAKRAETRAARIAKLIAGLP